MNTTAALAHSITWNSSKQSYLTALLLADRDMVDDCLRGYAYFRWADDLIDLSFQSGIERAAFITRQKSLIEALYRKEPPSDLCAEEEMLADLIAHDRGTNGGLRSFIQNFMTVIEFDANRKGHLVTRQELKDYTSCLATAVMDGIQYFIGNRHSYPKTMDRTLAVVGAHLVHMLRDILEDLPAGLVNIPVEDIQSRDICVGDLESISFRIWVSEQVERARVCLQNGKRYIDSLDVLRCKLAGAWYCYRFDWYLDTIQRDGYYLQRSYNGRRNLVSWGKMLMLGFTTTFRHFGRKIRRSFAPTEPGVVMGSEGNISSYRVR